MKKQVEQVEETFDYEKHTGFSKPIWEASDLEVII